MYQLLRLVRVLRKQTAGTSTGSPETGNGEVGGREEKITEGSEGKWGVNEEELNEEMEEGEKGGNSE